MPIRLIELEKLPAIDADRNRSFDNWPVDDARHQPFAPELSDLLPHDRATPRRKFKTCHHPYLLVNPITR
jgi:hypothetical protein